MITIKKHSKLYIQISAFPITTMVIKEDLYTFLFTQKRSVTICFSDNNASSIYLLFKLFI